MRGLILRAVNALLGPFPGPRADMIKALLLAEEGREPRASLAWLLGLHDFIAEVIDRQCIVLGHGVHIKHEIMDGIHSFFYERIPAGARVLDVGCGNGTVAHAIATHANATVIGIDTNEERIKFAREQYKHPGLKFIVGDATSALPEGSIDVVVMSSVIEHIPDRPALLKALSDRYHPSLFLIRAPMFERHYHAALKKMLGLFPYTDADHKIEYTVESFRSEMKVADLAIRSLEVRWGDIWAECVPE